MLAFVIFVFSVCVSLAMLVSSDTISEESEAVTTTAIKVIKGTQNSEITFSFFLLVLKGVGTGKIANDLCLGSAIPELKQFVDDEI